MHVSARHPRRSSCPPHLRASEPSGARGAGASLGLSVAADAARRNAQRDRASSRSGAMTAAVQETFERERYAVVRGLVSGPLLRFLWRYVLERESAGTMDRDA